MYLWQDRRPGSLVELRRMKIQRRTLLSEIDHWCLKNNTATRLHKEILTCFTEWSNKQSHGTPPATRQIAMDKVMRGYIPASWGHQQETHRQTAQLKTTGTAWAKWLVLFLCKQQHPLWKPDAQQGTSRSWSEKNLKRAHLRA
jgi:hypothetical protein